MTYLTPGLLGTPTPASLERALKNNTQLIVLSCANSETGVKLDLEGIAEVAGRFNIPLILDGVALLGKERFSIPPGVTGIGFSGHKIHGPKGVGFVFVRSGFTLTPLFSGGGQENKLRGGTENLSGILGLARALSILEEEGERGRQKMEKLRDRLEAGLKEKIPSLTVNGTGPRVVNTSNLCFPNVNGESLLIALDQEKIALSHGSACSSGALEPSRVLLNMGLSKKHAASSLRLSLSRMNTEEEIERAIKIIAARAKQLAAL